MKKIIYLSVIAASVISPASCMLSAVQTQRIPGDFVRGDGREAAEMERLQGELRGAKNQIEELNGTLKGKDDELDSLGRELQQRAQEWREAIAKKDSALARQREDFENCLKDKDTEAQEVRKQLEEARKKIDELQQAFPEERAAAGGTTELQKQIDELQMQNVALQTQVKGRLQLLVRENIDEEISPLCDSIKEVANHSTASKALENLHEKLARCTYAEIVSCEGMVNSCLSRVAELPQPSKRQSLTRADNNLRKVTAIQGLLARAKQECSRLQEAEEANAQREGISDEALKDLFERLDNTAEQDLHGGDKNPKVVDLGTLEEHEIFRRIQVSTLEKRIAEFRDIVTSVITLRWADKERAQETVKCLESDHLKEAADGVIAEVSQERDALIQALKDDTLRPKLRAEYEEKEKKRKEKEEQERKEKEKEGK